MKIEHVDNKDTDFLKLVDQLNGELVEVHGAELLEQYQAVNNLDSVIYVSVIYDNNEVVAGGGLRPYDQAAVEIKRVFVKKDYRRLGYGKKLIEDLEAWAKTLEYSEIILETGKKMSWAINFYRSLGYCEMENYGDYIGDPHAYCMKKALSSF